MRMRAFLDPRPGSCLWGCEWHLDVQAGGPHAGKAPQGAGQSLGGKGARPELGLTLPMLLHPGAELQEV